MKIQETGIRMIYHGKGVFSHPDGPRLFGGGDSLAQCNFGIRIFKYKQNSLLETKPPLLQSLCHARFLYFILQIHHAVQYSNNFNFIFGYN